MIVAIDPSFDAKKRGYALVAKDGSLRAWGRDCSDWPLCEWAVVEGQWFAPAGKVPPAALMKLSFSAGYLLACAQAPQHAVLPVRTWKDALIPGFAHADGDVFVENIRQMLRRRGHDVADTPHDVIDACGIALAAWKLRDRLTEYAPFARGAARRGQVGRGKARQG